MSKTTTKVEEVEALKTEGKNLDEKTGFLGLSLREIYDWEARHRQFCKTAHRQPCTCSAWD